MKNINVVVIGLGNIGFLYEFDPLISKRIRYSTHIKSIMSNSHFNLVGVCDTSRVARDRFKKEYKGIDVFEDHKSLLKNISFDMAVVATNTESHCKIINDCVLKGCKVILAEKPISDSYRDALEVIKYCKRAKVNLFVNYFRAFNPSYIKLTTALKDGKMGKIQSVSGKYTKGIFNNGTHILQLLLTLLGPVATVHAVSNPTIKQKRKSVDPTIGVLLAFKNGVSGFLEGLNNDCYSTFEIDLMFEKGRVLIVSDKVEVFNVERSKTVSGYKSLQKVNNRNFSFNMKPGLMPVYDKIYESLSTRKYCPLLPEESLEVVKIATRTVEDKT